MPTKSAAEQVSVIRTSEGASSTSGGRLDNLTLSRKEGWRRFVDKPARVRPEQLSFRDLGALGDNARAEYDKQRRYWHANIGPLKTPQLDKLHDELWEIIDTNVQDGDQAKGAVAIDAFPGLGKTTAVLAFAKKFDQRELADEGPWTEEGNERWPVCRVGLTGNTGMFDFNRAMLEFYAHPGVIRGTAAHFGRRAMDCMTSCGTKLLIIDDLHFLKVNSSNGVAISNHFKYIANEFPVTLIYIGVGLAKKGLYSDEAAYGEEVLDQTGRRTTPLNMKPFTIDNDEHRRQWRTLLLGLERKIVLADAYPGMLADDLSDYLFARSTGHINSLMTLLNRGCYRAVTTGTERLSKDLLDGVKNDVAAERARRELEDALAKGRLTTRVTRRRAR